MLSFRKIKVFRRHPIAYCTKLCYNSRKVAKQETEAQPMTYIQHYDSPLGGILLAADEVGLTGLWFEGQKYFARDLSDERTEQETPVLTEARRWLDIYFTGKEPDFALYT